MYKRGPNWAFCQGVFCHWLEADEIWFMVMKTSRARARSDSIFSRLATYLSCWSDYTYCNAPDNGDGTVRDVSISWSATLPVYTMHNSVPALWKSIRATRRFRADPLGRVFLPFVQLIPIPKCYPNSWLGGSSKHNWAMTDSIAGESFVESESWVKLFRHWKKSWWKSG